MLSYPIYNHISFQWYKEDSSSPSSLIIHFVCGVHISLNRGLSFCSSFITTNFQTFELLRKGVFMIKIRTPKSFKKAKETLESEFIDICKCYAYSICKKIFEHNIDMKWNHISIIS